MHISRSMLAEIYTHAGIEPSDAYRFLLFEVVAGTAVARIAAGEELVVLRRKAL